MDHMLPRLDQSKLRRSLQEEITAFEQTKIAISKLLIYAGLVLLLSQFVPIFVSLLLGTYQQLLSSSVVVEAVNNDSTSTQPPIAVWMLKRLVEDQYYDPGPEFFKTLTNAYSQNSKETSFTPKIDENYSKPMKISIPSVGIKDITLSPNVPAAPKEVYEKYLAKGVAHLKGTPLPGDGSNAIIYGHSGLSRLFSNSPRLAFTKLEKISVGDMVYIQKDGNTLTYKVISKKIVSPTALTRIVTPTKDDRITLVTCWPIGIGTKRLVVTAIRQ